MFGEMARLNKKMGRRKYENGILRCRNVDDSFRMITKLFNLMFYSNLISKVKE
jgi:hypothetical protein